MTNANNTNVSQRDRESDQPSDSQANALWGGRFAAGPDEIMQAINASVGFDQALAQQDIAGSRAHVAMLAETGIVSKQDAAAIAEGLDRIEAEIASGDFAFSAELEDVHMNIEARLAELIGPAAGRLHTARSRNDQVATDFKMWVRDALDRLDGALRACQAALIDRAEDHVETALPGFTHLQSAQPVTLGHHLMAYVEMFGRDRGRAADCRSRLNECPLGSAALAGTGFPIDRDLTAKTLGFDAPTRNSLDAVSDRDFALEYLSVASIAAVHVSRLADELVLWSSDSFGFVKLSDRFSTGSSIMPQKRNPDAAELARAKSGRVFGHLTGLLTTLKGLPLAYSKDMQEDKEPVFDTDASLMLCLAALTGMIADMQPNPTAMRAALERGFPTATDLADWLVREAGLPFREAHHVTGRVVRLAEDRQVGLDGLGLDELQAIDPRFTKGVFDVLSVEASLSSRASFGGTAPSRVRAAIAEARKRYL